MNGDVSEPYERSAAPARTGASASAGFDEDAALEDEIPF
jgi:hypothetical protein